MLLYHYSSELYDSLKTRRVSQTFSDKELESIQKTFEFRGSPGTYIDHISFFFDPLPSKTVGNVFKNVGHAEWEIGNVMYEYVVDVRDIPVELAYEIVESPVDIQTLEDTDWIYDDPEFTRNYLKVMSERKKRTGEVGYDSHGLLKQMRKFKGLTERYYLQAPTLRTWENGQFKYAANVPHLMLYPKGGIVNYRKVNTITIGSDIRTPVSK